MKYLGLVFAALATVLAGCSDSSSSTRPALTPAADQGIIDVLHASSDAPRVTVVAGGAAAATNLNYRDGVLLTADVGTLEISVNAQLPDGSTQTVIGPANVDITTTDRVTAIAINTTANIEPLILTQDVSNIAADEVQVRVVHAAPNAPMVDVYVSAPGTDITTEAPLGTFEFRGVLGAVTVPAGTYQLTVTPAGDPNTIAFQVDATLLGSQDVIVAAVTNTGVGASPINLVVSPVEPRAVTPGSRNAATLLDADTPSDLRVVHASPDAPNIDVVANDDFGAPVVTNLAYPDATGFLTLPATDINVKVVPTGASTPVVIDADLSLVAGNALTVLAIDTLANIRPLVLTDQTRRIATEAQVRIIHASPTAGDVDLYVVAPGTDITGVDPNFSAVPLGADTGYVSLAAGDYDVVVTATGSKTAAIGPVTVSLAAGGLYTAAARDEIGSGLPLGLILLDDF